MMIQRRQQENVARQLQAVKAAKTAQANTAQKNLPNPSNNNNLQNLLTQFITATTATNLQQQETIKLLKEQNEDWADLQSFVYLGYTHVFYLQKAILMRTLYEVIISSQN